MKTVILGGGPSGLGVAWGLVDAGHHDIIVIEKGDQLGGLSGSFSVDKARLDYGPHRLSPEYPDLVEKVSKLLGPELLEVPNEHAVAFKGRMYRYPPVLFDFTNFATVQTSFRVVISYAFERLRYAILSLFGKGKPASFEDIIVSRFGRVLYNEVVKPMSTKVWGDPAKLDPNFANLRFAVPTIVSWWKKLVGSNNNFNDKVFYYPKQGFQQLWDKLGEHLTSKGAQVYTSAEATSIEMDGDRVVAVQFRKANGELSKVAVDWLVSTIPTQAFLPLVKPSPVPKAEVMESRLKNRGMLMAYFLVKKEKALPARVVIFPEAKYCFNRLSEQNQFSRETVEPGYSAVLADILADLDSDTWALSDTAVIGRIANQIEGCGLFKRSEIVESQLFRVPIAYPLPTKDREETQEKLNDALSSFTNLICTGRFASSDYNNSHTALKKGLMAADHIHGMKNSAEWYQVANEIRKTAIRD